MSLHKKQAGGEIGKRLAMISGHSASLKKMWDDERECDELLTQISAVRAALDQTGKMILLHHIEHCVGEAVERGDASSSIKELKKSLDRFI